MPDLVAYVRYFHRQCPYLGERYVRSFANSLDEGALVWFQQLKLNNIASLDHLSTEFVRNYALRVEEPKTTGSLFEVIVRRTRSLAAFKRGLLVVGKLLDDYL